MRIFAGLFFLIGSANLFAQPISCGIIPIGLPRHFCWVNTETGETTIGPEIPGETLFPSESSFFNPLTNQFVVKVTEPGKYYTIDAESGNVVNVVPASDDIHMPRIDRYTGLVYALSSAGPGYQIVRINTLTGILEQSFTLSGFDQSGNTIPAVYDAINKHYILKAHSLSDPDNVDRYFIIDVLSGNILSNAPTSQHVDFFRIHPETGAIYGMWDDGGVYHFVSVDPWTAAVTIISTLDDLYPVSSVYDNRVVLDPINETYIFAGESNFEDYYFTLNIGDGSIECVADSIENVFHLQRIYNYSGVGELSGKSRTISLYPNPAETQALVFSNQEFYKATLSISNSTGQTVRTIENITGNSVTIDRENLGAGIYFISVWQQGVVIWTTKIELK
jgi:hypothetical protein